MKSQYDVVILGAGHNGLVAASYLGRAGLSVLLLEKNDYVGGAATSQKVFPDYDAQLSRYSYLVSLFPEKIIRDLGLKLELRRRTTASFTPYLNHGQHDGLLLSNVDEEVSRQSMFELTGNNTEFEQMKAFYSLSRIFAEQVWDTMLEPLIAKDEFRRRFNADDVTREAWRSLVEEPLGTAIERYLKNDLVRGLVFTDAKIGVLTHPHDPSLLQNRCFIYHLVGNKTGEWKVPVGGMGAVVRELELAARNADAEILTNVDLRALGLAGEQRTVEFYKEGEQQSVEARYLLVNFGRNVLARYIGQVVPAGCHGRRLRVQDQHAPAAVAEIEGDEIYIGPGLAWDVSQRRRLHANECQLRSSMQRAAAEQSTLRSLLPHIDRRQHSCARAARERFPHDDVVRTGCAMELVCAR